MVNVVIGTANRPQMLRQALRSVSAQTARKSISTVLVSENGGNRESRQICAEFPELPIKYVFREPAVSPLEHGRILMSEGLCDEFTAILHDDDWWSPDHIANGLLGLQTHPSASSFYSCHFEVAGESSVLWCENNLLFWFGAGFPDLSELWKLSLDHITLAALLATPGRFSTIIARTEMLRNAFAVVLALNNPFDSDRMLIVQLARCGSVLYRPVPDVFIRRHPNQDSWSFAERSRAQHMINTTEWLLKTSGERQSEILKQFKGLVDRCPIEARDSLMSYLKRPWCLPRLAAIDKTDSFFQKLIDPNIKPDPAKSAIRQLIPPLIWNALKRLGGSSEPPKPSN
jgi:hypothetical protein